MNEYKWAPGSRLTKKIADPQMVGDALDDLQQQNNGRITARVVVDAARPEDAPLHPCFEWDNLRAAELYREDQARHVINSVRIVHRSEDASVPVTLVHAFVNLTETVGDDEERGYIPMARVMREPSLLAQALERAAAELKAIEERYKQYELIATSVRQARLELETAQEQQVV